MILVISCSLSPTSRSRMLAESARDCLAELDETTEFIDLQKHTLPFCDGSTAYQHPHAIELNQLGQNADAILLATPVYNFSVSATTKNLVELTGRSWASKPVGMLLAAGGHGSYMAGMGLANSLMLDFRCLVIPRFVYAGPSAFQGNQIGDPAVHTRIAELAHELLRVSRALKNAPPIISIPSPLNTPDES